MGKLNPTHSLTYSLSWSWSASWRMMSWYWFKTMTSTLWHSAVDRGQSIRIVLVDFAKAFDHVDHNILVNKMQALGLSDTVVRWRCSFPQGRRQWVKIDDVMSGSLPVTAGMPQGSHLGPLTYIILINWLNAADTTHKYVDDTTLTVCLLCLYGV